ncbi:MAG: M3 family oligoendopeptidase [Desulfuromonadales bacterium]|nr:M3 family oligoendopeptidase [Desulfuromonadales bacterium]
MITTPSLENCWDLTPLYLAPDDPAWERDLQGALSAAQAFAADWRGTLDEKTMSAPALAAALQSYAALQKQGLQPYFYAQLLFSAKSDDDRHKALFARAREVWHTVTETTLFFELDLLRLSHEIFVPLLSAPELQEYKHYLQQLRAHAPYTLSEAVEQALKRKDLSGKEAFAQLFEEVTGEMRFTFTFPAEESPREASGEELLALLYHPDGNVREGAFSTFLQGHAAAGTVLVACFNNIFLDHGKEAELRGYPQLMTPTHLESETAPAMVEKMMDVSEANYRLGQEYFALKRQLLGLERMKNTDLYAPLSTQVRHIDFAEAQGTVLAAFQSFSPQLAELAQSFFAEKRIDVFPASGKSGGAFCHGMAPGIAPYILTNYTGTLRDLSTLAHELGHGVHFVLSGRQNLYNYNAPLPLAETASVFAEILLTRHLLAVETDPQLKIALLCSKIEEIIATTLRQNVLTRFELAAHRKRGEGLLSSDDLCALWLNENGKLFGDAVEMIEPYRWGWSYISHFIQSRFYCYSYIFGELVTLALYRRYQQEGASFVPKYFALLASGGSQSPVEALRPFGIDLNAPEFWQEGYDLVRELLTELRQLIEKGRQQAS